MASRVTRKSIVQPLHPGGWDACNPPAVAIVGAGISGLSAAHELAERGFKVVVFEKSAPDECVVGGEPIDGNDTPVNVGGLAATQYATAYPRADLVAQIVDGCGDVEVPDTEEGADPVVARRPVVSPAVSCAASPVLLAHTPAFDVNEFVRVFCPDKGKPSEVEKYDFVRTFTATLMKGGADSDPTELFLSWWNNDETPGSDQSERTDVGRLWDQVESLCAYHQKLDAHPYPPGLHTLDPRRSDDDSNHWLRRSAHNLKKEEARYGDTGGFRSRTQPAIWADDWRLRYPGLEITIDIKHCDRVSRPVVDELNDLLNRALFHAYSSALLAHYRSTNDYPIGWGDNETDAEFHARLARRLVVVKSEITRDTGLPPEYPCLEVTSRVRLAAFNPCGGLITPISLPGEHGYRFFPSCYRHLFDLMKRTPILDESGRETRHTVYDELTPTHEVILAEFPDDAQSPCDTPEAPCGDNRRIHAVRRSLPRSIKQAREDMQLYVRDLGLTGGDAARFSTAMLRYLTSSTLRRHHEYENQSWWDFVGGEKFSAQGRKHLRQTPRALAAMDAKGSDARTQGNMIVQLALDQLGDGSTTDMILTNPTSEAWLEPWRRYLESIDVTFVRGELKSITPSGDTIQGKRFAANVRIEDPETSEAIDLAPYMDRSSEEEIYFRYVLLATDVQTAYKAVTTEGVGPERRSDSYWMGRWANDTDVRTSLVDLAMYNPEDAAGGMPKEHPYLFGSVPPAKNDRMRWISGIQYYLPQDLTIARGHIFYLDSPWALTSVSQRQFWRRGSDDPMRGVVRSIISVDIGEFGTSGLIHPRAFNCSQAQLAEETWEQITRSLTPPGLKFPAPPIWHLDNALRFNPCTRRMENGTPYHVNPVCDYQTRPGRLPSLYCIPDHADPAATATYFASRDRLRRAEPHYDTEYLIYGDPIGVPETASPDGRKPVDGDYNCVLLAGTFNKTYTRITSMEAANESARHAVNAIMQSSYARTGMLFGEKCSVWDLEENEIDDLNYFKRIDEALFNAGYPHAMEILESATEGQNSPADISRLINKIVSLVAEKMPEQFNPEGERLVQSLSLAPRLVQVLLESLESILVGDFSGGRRDDS